MYSVFTESDTCIKFKHLNKAIQYLIDNNLKHVAILSKHEDKYRVYVPSLTGARCVKKLDTENLALHYIGDVL